MKITRIEIENFKCFETNDIGNLSKRFNLFIGNNGEGKTAILDAMASVLDNFVYTFGIDSGLDKRRNDEDWVRKVTRKLGEETKVELQYPLMVKCSGKNENKDIVLERLIRNRKVQKSRNYIQFAKELKNACEVGNQASLPLVAYYGNNRLWQPDNNKKSNKESLRDNSRFIGYRNSLNAGRSIGQLVSWLSDQFQEELIKNQPSVALTVVKQAVADCLDEWNTLAYQPGESSEGVVAVSSTGQKLPIHLLSDGYRNILTIVADIAYRASLLNPHFGDHAAKDILGIVLIDELDLHLHPTWQEKVIEDLSQTFPKIQFFATTHSPIIIQSLHEGKLIKLKAQTSHLDDEDEEETYEYVATDAYRDQSPEDILEDVMDKEMPQRSRRYREMLEVSSQYYDILERAKNAKTEEDTETLERLKEHLDELSVRYGDNPAYYSFLAHQRKVSKVD